MIIFIWILIVISILVFYDLLETIGDTREYKIISIDKNTLILTKWPFYKKHYVYYRNPLVNMPWVANNNYDSPKSYLLVPAIKKYKLNKQGFYEV